MITKEDKLLRSILGPSPLDIRPLSYSFRQLKELVFEQGFPVDDIRLERNIYSPVARPLDRSSSTVARSVELLANRCWNSMDAEQKQKYIGRYLEDITGPKDLVIYFAYYCHYGKNYYDLHHI